MERIEVIASFDWLEREETVGILGYEKLRGTDMYTFEYSRQWLKDHSGIILGKDLQPFTGKLFSQGSIFGCFSDALPDLWGRKLIELQTKQLSHGNGRSACELSDWDYLMGVEDSLRMGALRFKDPDAGSYVNASDKYQAPLVLSIGELLEASSEVERSELSQESPDKEYIQKLFKPGTSAGGARPKACVSDGTDLYIAKFPSVLDGGINAGKWEYFANRMAKECGIRTAMTRLVHMNTGHDIFLSKRFDRTMGMKRVHMASALTLLGLPRGAGADTGHGYPDIADFIVSGGTSVGESLEELYRRVAFSIIIGNSDDHFKNHSFLLTRKGWVLSPVYDINPSVYRNHSLLIDAVSNESSLETLFNAHKLYYLDKDKAHGIISNVSRKMKHWRSTAAACGISYGEMNRYAERFETGNKWDIAKALKR